MGRIQALGRPNLPKPKSKWLSEHVDKPIKPNSIINNLPKSSRSQFFDSPIRYGAPIYNHLVRYSVTATSLIAICDRIGPNLTALHVLPKLKEPFDELAFSQETSITSGSLKRSLKAIWTLLLLYPPFTSLLSIENFASVVPHGCFLSNSFYGAITGSGNIQGSPVDVVQTIISKRPVFSKSSTSSEYNPAKLLLNGVGWSILQSQGNRSAKNLMPHKRASDLNQDSVDRHSAASWDGPGFLGHVGSLRDELRWKIRASVMHSICAHHGALISLAVCQDECIVFTVGVGPRFKGIVQKWDLSRINCTSGYYGHEEKVVIKSSASNGKTYSSFQVVNDICVLSSHERVASCDGTVHVWNIQTANSARVWKLISIFVESSANSAHVASPSTSTSKINTDQPNMLNSNPLLSGIFSTSFAGSLYTCMHHLEFIEKLVVGTGNVQPFELFIDVTQGQKLHLWRSESGESSFPSLIYAICGCGSNKMQADEAVDSPSWIAAGLSSGICKLIDVRSGNIISLWRAHDAYVTKLAAPDEHLLISSSLDRTLRVWDLRTGKAIGRRLKSEITYFVSDLLFLWTFSCRNLSSHPSVFRSHSDTVSSFSVWGQDVISIAKNKIGLSSLARSADEVRQLTSPPAFSQHQPENANKRRGKYRSNNQEQEDSC
ncbi:hypothetical protein HYC85_013137 [Camellia sinensis]|uniref:Uncharacterized protein n=1 Tax=Camellia sinensis TaxID=4442 RepID=A0A7J7H2K1_CAMSI|nr:hypothetical protein HYC85_013137 [Camellia sinensis]